MRVETSQKCLPSRGGLHPLLFNNAIGVFAQPKLGANPTHCFHPFPILGQNNTAQQKLGLKLEVCIYRTKSPPPTLEVGGGLGGVGGGVGGVGGGGRGGR